MELRVLPSKTLFVILGALLALTFMMAFSSKASAHGYVEGPKSRALLCAEGTNKDCGAIVYEPQSLEGPGNFPSAGVADGKIASAGGAFPKLDEQSATRWAKVPMTSGANTFTWKLTAAHATDKWDYYITKEGWDPNSPLKRSDLELFCSIDDGGKRPGFSVSHNCVVPERTGYHVILAYWEVFDTANAFYNVIDANFDGGFVEPEEPGEPDPEEPGIGDIPVWSPSSVYLQGDRVSYNGAIYEAKWWTQNDKPSESQVWLLVEGEESGNNDNDNTNINAWDSSKVYLSGDQVQYNGIVYEAKWWTQGEAPGDSSVWKIVN